MQVVADDGPDTSTPVGRNITITPVNDAPGAPTPAPSVNSVRNTTLVSGTTTTEPNVTRPINLLGNSTDPDGLESAHHRRAGHGRRNRAGRPDHA